MLWLPTVSVEVAQVAAAATKATGPHTVVAPSLKVTVPDGVPAAGAVALTVAEKVTLWAKLDGFAELVTAVVVLPLLTIWLTATEVLVVKLALPA